MEDAPRRRCAYLEALLESAVGLPLRPAVQLVSRPTSRGRVGNALQWHLGLEAHDGEAELDWEDQIELKVVSVWRTRGGGMGCDKLKVCDANVDPAHKLSNVAFVLVDRITRVVVGHRLFGLQGPARAALVDRWSADPHFERAPLFIEDRSQGDRSAPAYYLSSSWLVETLGLHRPMSGVYPFDGGTWTRLRQEGRGRDPLLSVLDARSRQGVHRCPRCGGTLRLDPQAFAEVGVAPARHDLVHGSSCNERGHLAVDGHALGPLVAGTLDELLAGIEERVPPEAVWRLADRVPEPDDHMHT